MIKWFWTNINFRKWTFEGRKIVNPLLIIWRIFCLPFLYIMLGFACLILILMCNKNAAIDLWETGTPYF